MIRIVLDQTAMLVTCGYTLAAVFTLCEWMIR